MPSAVVIVSGGMDSVTLAYYLIDRCPEKMDLHFLSFDYGQRHVKELECAGYHATQLGAAWDVVDLTSITKLLAPSGSVLVDMDTEVPEGHYAEDSMRATVVPNRNAIMLSIATGVAVAEHALTVAAGMHAGDHYIYPDCRPAFLAPLNTAFQRGNKGFWHGHIMAPFIEMSKTDICRLGTDLGVDYSMTWSCYVGGQYHCGKCGTCVERIEAFRDAGVDDPTIYA
jgi:7-cyano-7-deazaguanine synthase